MTLAAIGWTVVHSLWQWTLVAGVVSVLLGLLKDARPHTRYVVGWAGLVAMVVVSAATAVLTAMAIEPPIRHRLLYTFNGALIMPEVFARGTTVLRVAGGLWLAGVAIGATRVALGWRRVRQLRSVRLVELDGDAADALTAVGRALDISRRVSVQLSGLAAVPMVLGWRRPQILLPADSATRLTSDQRRAILAHELGHVRRGDFIANAVQVIVDVLLFHHPAPRLISRSMRREREYACDDLAVAVTNDAQTYARALAALEDARSESHLVVAAASGTLLDRVQRILGQPRVLFTPARGMFAAGIAVLVAAVMFVLAMNVPPPWLPSGIRLRRPAPAGAISVQQPAESRKLKPES